jgi:spore coat protein U-like protein
VRRALALLAALACVPCIAAPAAAVNGSPATRSKVVHPLGGCSATVSAFSFSAFSPSTHAGRVTQGYVSFDCASPVSDIELSAGNSGQFRSRSMSASGEPNVEVSYNIFLDANHTQVFGDGTGGSSAYVPGPNVSKGGFAIYGEIAYGQSHLGVATYTDAIRITVNLVP